MNGMNGKDAVSVELERELEIAQGMACRWLRRYRVGEEGVEQGASSQIREQLS